MSTEAHLITPALHHHPSTPYARRRGLLLAALLGALAVVTVVAGAWQAWPLFAVPLILAAPLAGTTGLAASTLATGMVFALISGMGASGLELTAGLVAFVVVGASVGVAVRRHDRELARAQAASAIDRLTGLPNFAALRDALERECRRVDRHGGDLSLALLDLDGFKGFNDEHGHETGNRLLAAVAAEMAAVARSSDMVARYGGEEFALLVPGDADQAVRAADRVRRAISGVTVLVPSGEARGVTLSGGVAAYRRGTGHAQDLIEDADRALYLSKARGRDRVSLAGTAAEGLAA